LAGFQKRKEENENGRMKGEERARKREAGREGRREGDKFVEADSYVKPYDR